MNRANDSDPALVISSLDRQRIEAFLARQPYKDMPAVPLLKKELERADIVPPMQVPPNVITMNSQVLFLELDSNAEYGLTLVYPDCVTHPGGVSVLASVGAALLGLSVGQAIAWTSPRNRRLRLQVLDLVYQPEANRLYHL